MMGSIQLPHTEAPIALWDTPRHPRHSANLSTIFCYRDAKIWP